MLIKTSDIIKAANALHKLCCYMIPGVTRDDDIRECLVRRQYETLKKTEHFGKIDTSFSFNPYSVSYRLLIHNCIYMDYNGNKSRDLVICFRNHTLGWLLVDKLYGNRKQLRLSEDNNWIYLLNQGSIVSTYARQLYRFHKKVMREIRYERERSIKRS